MHCHLWQPNKPDKTAISNKPISSWITKNNPIGTTIFLLCIASFFFLLCPPYKQRYNRCTSSAVWSKAASRLNLYDFVMIKFTICQRNRKVMKLLYVTVDGKILVFPTEYWAQLSMYVLHSSGCPRTSTLEKNKENFQRLSGQWMAYVWLDSMQGNTKKNPLSQDCKWHKINEVHTKNIKNKTQLYNKKGHN